MVSGQGEEIVRMQEIRTGMRERGLKNWIMREMEKKGKKFRLYVYIVNLYIKKEIRFEKLQCVYSRLYVSTTSCKIQGYNIIAYV